MIFSAAFAWFKVRFKLKSNLFCVCYRSIWVNKAPLVFLTEEAATSGTFPHTIHVMTGLQVAATEQAVRVDGLFSTLPV